MCGIAGWLYLPHCEPGDDVLANMPDSIRHRDPVDTADFRDREAAVALAHRRLSIIDLTDASHRPILDDERQIALTYRGQGRWGDGRLARQAYLDNLSSATAFDWAATQALQIVAEQSLGAEQMENGRRLDKTAN